MLEDICDVTLSINFAKSQDNQSESHTPVYQQKNAEKYKCFKCYGTNSYGCNECFGSQKISSTNPMAVLLNSILMKKINFKRLAEEKSQNSSVGTIKQEEEEVDQKRLVCYYCESECQNSVFQCKDCPWFIVCPNCSSRSNEHIHIISKQLTTSLGQVSEEVDRKNCFNCGQKIQNCYSICRTCQGLGASFWICDMCSDKNNYIHQKTHLLQTVIHFDTLKDRNLQTYSEEFQEEIEIFSVDSGKNELQVPQNQCRMHHKNSSIARHLEEDDSPLLRTQTNHDSKYTRKDVVSRVRFEIDGLFSSADFNSEIASKNILKPPKVQKQQGFSCLSSECSKSKEKDKENKSYEQLNSHIFFGYKCDICDIEPIKDVKYHCGECEDFDVCLGCFEEIEFHHEHEHYVFERADGKSIKQKAFERISNCRQSISKTIRRSATRKLTRSKTQGLNTLFTRF